MLRRSIARVLGRPLAALVGFGLRLSDRKLGLAVLYHGVGDPQGDHERDLVAPHGSRLFEQQVRHLRASYRIVEASQLLAATRSRRRGQRFPVAITFDDDLACHVRVALPILHRLGAPATFFLSGASLSAPFAFWWERLQVAADRGILAGAAAARADETLRQVARRIELMRPTERDAIASELHSLLGPDPSDSGIRADDVRRLVDGGMRIGFHTKRHDALTLLDHNELQAAMAEGRSALEELAGHRLELIAYPHGRADGRVAAAALDAGFTVGFTAAGEPVRATSDPLLLPRVMPYYRSAGQFALQLVLQLRSTHDPAASP